MTSTAFLRRLPQAIIHNASTIWRRDEGRLLVHLRRLFRSLDIQTALDIGANRGRYIEQLRTIVGFSGDIIAFEPIPENADLIAKQARYDARLKVEPFALGAGSETRTLNIARHDAMSSLHAPVSDGVERFSSLGEIQKRIEVRVEPLDAIAERLLDGATGGVFLKIDAQGADLDILAGARNTLARIDALQVEIPFTPLYEDIPAAHDYFATIDEAGFALTGVFPVHSLEDHRIIDVDAVFRKKPAG